MKPILLIQGSLNSDSKTALVLKEAAAQLHHRGVAHEWLDLRKLNLEFCDGRSLNEYNPDMQRAHGQVKNAAGYIFGMPVYCFSVSGPLKNFIDITSDGMENKAAAIICNAGGRGSYMALGDLAKILAFESRVVTVQPSIYTMSDDFADGRLINDKIPDRIGVMLDALLDHLKMAHDG